MDLESELSRYASSWILVKSSDGTADLALFQNGELIFHTIQNSVEAAVEEVRFEFGSEKSGILIRIPEIFLKKNKSVG